MRNKSFSIINSSYPFLNFRSSSTPNENYTFISARFGQISRLTRWAELATHPRPHRKFKSLLKNYTRTSRIRQHHRPHCARTFAIKSGPALNKSSGTKARPFSVSNRVIPEAGRATPMTPEKPGMGDEQKAVTNCCEPNTWFTNHYIL